jgi:hypothetical protein
VVSRNDVSCEADGGVPTAGAFASPREAVSTSPGAGRPSTRACSRATVSNAPRIPRWATTARLGAVACRSRLDR